MMHRVVGISPRLRPFIICVRPREYHLQIFYPLISRDPVTAAKHFDALALQRLVHGAAQPVRAP